MEFRLLGPLEVERRGRLVAMGGVKQRSLLALLLLHTNDIVSVDTLIEGLWGSEPPASAVHSLEVYASRVRAVLGPPRARMLERRPGGYVFHVAPVQLDLCRFELSLAEGKRALTAGDLRLASERLLAAIREWRGDALADLAYEPFATVHAARLDELRLVAVESWVEAELRLGRHADVVAELESLVRAHPLREHLRCQLMLALYRCERQAEALEVYKDGRRRLVEDLGIEPGTNLRMLEQSILRQDSQLAAPGAEGGELPWSYGPAVSGPSGSAASGDVLERLFARAPALLEAGNAAGAVREFLRAGAEAWLVDHDLCRAYVAAGPDGARLLAFAERLAKEARAQRSLPPGVTGRDLVLLQSALGTAGHSLERFGPDAHRHFVDVVAESLVA